MQKPLAITAYFDTRPGHIKQTRGIIQALSDLTPVQLKEIVLPEYGIPQSIADWIKFAASFFSSPKKNRKILGTHQDIIQDIIIGTGTHTHIPMLLQKQKSGGRIISCMMPERPLLKYIDLCFVPEHDDPPDRANIFITQGPPNTAPGITSGIKPNIKPNIKSDIQDGLKDGLKIDRQNHDPQKGLIVIGGVDNKTHIWNNEKIIEQLKAVLRIQPHISWTISTSPRTPDNMLLLLESVARNFADISFMPFEKTGSGWIENEYAKSSIVWVSADSVSMVFEALSAGCRVGVLSVDWKKDNNKIARAVKLLEQQKKIISFENFINKPEYAPQCALNEASRCAVEILRRWWKNRLP